MSKHRIVILSFAITLIAVLVAGGAAQAATVAHVKVGANGNTFSPKVKSVSTNTKVVWTNVGGNHTVTAYSSNWSKKASLGSGASTSFTFKNKGTYKYRCTIHSTLSGGSCSGMCGVIKVG
jgi:plastocyanin